MSNDSSELFPTGVESDPDLFDRVWVRASRRGSKAKAKRKFFALSQADQGLCSMAVENYAAWCDGEKTALRYRMHLTTFLSQDHWPEWIEAENHEAETDLVDQTADRGKLLASAISNAGRIGR